MKNKTMGFITAISVMLFCYATMAHSESSVETLFKYREYIKQWVEGCRPSEFREQRLAVLNELDKKELNYFGKNKSQIITAFTELCHLRVKGNLPCASHRSYGLLDSIQTDIFVNILKDVPREQDKLIEDILKKIPYSYLLQHRDIIINILRRGDNINRFTYLGAVINPPEDIKRKVLASEKLSDGLRARLGDKEVEDELIQRVNNYTREKNFLQLSKDLFLCGTNECLKAAVELFAKFEPEMNKTNDCAAPLVPDRGAMGAPTPRIRLIKNFRLYHPDLPLLFSDFYELEINPNRTEYGIGVKWDMIVDYMEKFVAWGNAEYGAKAKLTNWFLFDGQCKPLEARERTLKEWKARPDHEKWMREIPGYKNEFFRME
ncbi:MAG: hypothetical protein LBI42_08660, partial [Chitinispirillales bacterium]|nr:hypothetical protein [Chitinispirillales bacterium]